MKHLLNLLYLLAAFQSSGQTTLNPDPALSWLKAGNESFVRSQFNEMRVDSSFRFALSKAQTPKAVILTCSDSRVSPELIFGKGLGDLFVIRVAGNIADDAVIGSIEYAVEHLHTSLIVVMGHKSCGAINAAVDDMQHSGHGVSNHVRTLIDRIEEAVAIAKLPEKDPTQNALLSNVMFTVAVLKHSRPVLHDLVEKGEIKIVGAVYDLATGKVEWLSDMK
jgi:carbonic anhydrase